MPRHGLLRFARNDGERAERSIACVTLSVTARRANHLRRAKPVQPAREKYSASRSPQINRTTPAIPRPQEGRIAIVTDVGCGERWPRQRRARKTFSQGELAHERRPRAANGAEADGKAVWSWRPWLALSRRRCCEPNRVCQHLQSAGDGGKRNSSPGRARYKP
jgi:hypothetical protein